MSDLNNYFLALDTKKAHDQLEEVEQKRKDTESAIDKTTKEANQKLGRAWMKAVSVMQGTWHSLETMMRATGTVIPELYREVIAATFGSAKILIPLFTAMELNPFTVIQGVLGLASIAMSVSAAVMAQQDKEAVESKINDLNSFVGGVSSFIGVWSF